jgi:hypothetical protein
MIITIKLDLQYPRKAQQDNTNDDTRKRRSDEARNARLQCWLEESVDQSPWNILVDARPHSDRAI